MEGNVLFNDIFKPFYRLCSNVYVKWRKEGNDLFNDIFKPFYRLCYNVYVKWRKEMFYLTIHPTHLIMVIWCQINGKVLICQNIYKLYMHYFFILCSFCVCTCVVCVRGVWKCVLKIMYAKISKCFLQCFSHHTLWKVKSDQRHLCRFWIKVNRKMTLGWLMLDMH